MRFVDHTGKRFGMLVVTERAVTDKKETHWQCLCDCGETTVKSANGLLSGKVKSCGCSTIRLKSENNTTHNMSRTRFYQIWADMLGRCNSPSNSAYQLYGSRGIKVCERWEKFENFYEDMKEGYTDDLTIEREDVNGHYEKSNCKWATTEEQGKNKRNSFFLTVNGERKTIREWSSVYGVTDGAIRYRLSAKWDPEKAVKKVSQRSQLI